MKQLQIFALSLFLTFAFQACTTPVEDLPYSLSEHAIIPVPLSVTNGEGSFTLTDRMDVFVADDADQETRRLAQNLTEKLNAVSGFALEVKEASKQPSRGIYFSQANDNSLGDEGYKLSIERRLVTLSANSNVGLFYGIQTLRQLFPSEIELGNQSDGYWQLPMGTITDSPLYEHRGSMLDVSRHFFTVGEVKQYIDLLAYYKMNVFHIHLTDDQGWRIQIDSWPKLTEIGSTKAVGDGKGGFYTKEDFNEIVRYAEERFITVIPEIDIPGHTTAALASYGELNCDGKARELFTGTRVGFSTLCTSSETTYQFLDDVFRELAEISPGKYIHIGGDESMATEKKDYVYFLERVQKILAKYDKKMIGWDEVSQIDLNEGNRIQFWNNQEHVKEALGKGAKIIMSPAPRAYLDMKYDSTTEVGYRWAGYIEVDHAYNWSPAGYIEGMDPSAILGVEAPLWSETIDTIDEVEFLAYPRLAGYAEIGWSPDSLRNWETYKLRLAQHASRLKALGVNFYRSPKVPWAE